MNRPASRTLFIAAAVIAATGLGHRAQAQELNPSGLSVDVGFEQNLDGTVTQAGDDPGTTSRSGYVDGGVLANVGNFAFGVGAGFAPNVFGNGRLLLGARAGWQPLYDGNRLHFLAEGGLDRFEDIGGTFFGSSTPSSFNTPYVGIDVGLSRNLGHSPLEYGVSLHVRQDLDHQTMIHTENGLSLYGAAPPPTVTAYSLGGTMIGLSLTIGFRAQAHHPAVVQ